MLVSIITVYSQSICNIYVIMDENQSCATKQSNTTSIETVELCIIDDETVHYFEK